MSGHLPPEGGSHSAVDQVYRTDWGYIVATLIRLLGDFDVAEEAAQDAFAVAVEQWPATGIPAYPRAWLIQTARNKAVDRLRRRARLEQKLESYAVGEEDRVQAPPELEAERSPTTASG